MNIAGRKIHIPRARRTAWGVVIGFTSPIEWAKDEFVSLRRMSPPMRAPASCEYPMMMLVCDLFLSYLSMIACAAISKMAMNV